jgi:hypothetical protein
MWGMEEKPSRDDDRAAKPHWARRVPFVLAGVASTLSGAHQLATPADCLHGYRIGAVLTEWMCRSMGGIATGALFLLLGLVIVFVTLTRK